MTLKERYGAVLAWFEAENPNPVSELRYETPFQLLVAVILSAQCTDKRVNMVTPELFRACPDAEALAAHTPMQIFQFIRSISYPNSKAQHLVAMSRQIIERHNGRLPSTVRELMQLPGVGRKTANVIASVIFHQPRMAVDTHVFRVAARIGLTVDARTVLAAERQLVANIPVHLIARAHHWLILHGRYLCLAKKPQCRDCGLAAYCLYHTDPKPPDESLP
ncbi:MAG: endonuclease III [Tannerellaceae bacterium]|nr:endonuclease III [Tannerellaceae bacterium]